jgi:hypothetical protein
MTTQELKNAFNEAINNAKDAGTDGDTIARMEILREWHSNPEFPKMLADFTAPIAFNMARGQA